MSIRRRDLDEDDVPRVSTWKVQGVARTKVRPSYDDARRAMVTAVPPRPLHRSPPDRGGRRNGEQHLRRQGAGSWVGKGVVVGTTST